MSTVAKSFLENFGLRAFGGWSRPVRPGTEAGMFAYDESTAELFAVEEDYTDVAYVGVEPVAEAAEVAGMPGERIPIRLLGLIRSAEDPTAWVFVDAPSNEESQPNPGSGEDIVGLGRGLTSNEIFVERRPQGDYIVRKRGSERASVVTPTQAGTVNRARTITPNASAPMERARDTDPRGRDKWRKP